MRTAYTDEVVVKALAAVEGGKTPVQVARHFNIPIGTIQSWMRKGRGPALYGKTLDGPKMPRKSRRKARKTWAKNVETVAANPTKEVEFLRGLVLRLAAALAPK